MQLHFGDLMEKKSNNFSLGANIVLIWSNLELNCWLETKAGKKRHGTHFIFSLCIRCQKYCISLDRMWVRMYEENVDKQICIFFTCVMVIPLFLHILIHISSNGLFFAPHTNLVWKDAFLGDICFDKGCCKGFIWGCVAGVLCRKWFTSANAGSVFVVGGWVIGLIEVIRRSPTVGAPLPKLGPSIGSPPLPVMKYFTWCFIIQKILVSVTTYFWAIICISWHHCMYLYIIKIYF